MDFKAITTYKDGKFTVEVKKDGKVVRKQIFTASANAMGIFTMDALFQLQNDYYEKALQQQNK